MRLPIQLLYTQGCQGYHQALDSLSDALEELDYEPKFEMLRIRTQEDAEKHGFFASPTIRINGLDIEEKAREIKVFGLGACRPYFWEDRAYDYPPKKMILNAIKTLLS